MAFGGLISSSDQGIRPDGRPFQSIRPTACTLGNIRAADGSATVQIGDTSVVAGTVLSAVSLPPGRERAGRIQVAVELGPICSTRFQGTKQSDQALALSQFLNRIVKDSKMLKFGELTITDDIVWVLKVSVTCTNYDGNLTDASLLAVVAALLNTKLPSVELNQQGELVETDSPCKRLEVQTVPVSLTHAVFNCDGACLSLVDPASMEEESSNALVTVVVVVPNNCPQIPTLRAWESAPVIVHKPGGVALPVSTLADSIRNARNRAQDIVNLILQDLQPG